MFKGTVLSGYTFNKKSVELLIFLLKAKPKTSLSPTLPSHFLCTDSSDFGWGGAFFSRDDPFPMSFVSALWEGLDQKKHITYKELKAILHSLESLPQFVLALAVLSDNQSAVLELVRGSAQSERQWIVLKIWKKLLHQKIFSVRADFIPGSINFVADTLSRFRTPKFSVDGNFAQFKSFEKALFEQALFQFSPLTFKMFPPLVCSVFRNTACSPADLFSAVPFAVFGKPITQ